MNAFQRKTIAELQKWVLRKRKQAVAGNAKPFSLDEQLDHLKRYRTLGAFLYGSSPASESRNKREGKLIVGKHSVKRMRYALAYGANFNVRFKS